MLGGGPFNYTESAELKTPVHRRIESDLRGLLDLVVATDFPFLGACYGIGALGSHEGAAVDRQYAEAVGCVTISLTAGGRADPLLHGLPPDFDAFVGHKEAISALPGHAALLASSPGCPVQAFRIGSNVYATQFHPELNVDGLCTRIDVYKHAGYFEPDQAEELKATVRHCEVTHPHTILRNFVARHTAGGQPRR
jgi:GMP synthase (glutamine-hydrolysing)